MTSAVRYGPEGGPDGYRRRQAETVEVLQALIRTACVNDGTPESGQEARNADLLTQLLEVPGIELARFSAAPGRDSLDRKSTRLNSSH